MHQQLQDVYSQTTTQVSYPFNTNWHARIYINICVNSIHFAWALLCWKPYIAVISPTTLGTSNYMPSIDHKILPNLLKLKCHKILLLSTKHQFFCYKIIFAYPKFLNYLHQISSMDELKIDFYCPIVSFGSSHCNYIYGIYATYSWSWCWCCK
jgi:hypothetical protein